MADISTITVETCVRVPIESAWVYWTEPQHITEWNQSSDDWHTPFSKNDLRPGGRFLSRMEAKDGTFGFDFKGTYDDVVLHKAIAYTLDDGRKVRITFTGLNSETRITEAFEAEATNTIELQRGGWQAILNNFKDYAENH